PSHAPSVTGDSSGTGPEGRGRGDDRGHHDTHARSRTAAPGPTRPSDRTGRGPGGGRPARRPTRRHGGRDGRRGDRLRRSPRRAHGGRARTGGRLGPRPTGAVRRGELLPDAGIPGRTRSPGPGGDLRVVPVPLADPAVADLLEPGDLVDLVGPTDPDAPVAGD